MLSLIQLRNRHFMLAVRSIVESHPDGKNLDLDTVASLASIRQAPCYYCTYNYALRVLRVLRHGRLRLRRDRRYALWREINDRVDRLIEVRGITLPEALANVLADGCASQFFIAPSTAARILRQHYCPDTQTFLIP